MHILILPSWYPQTPSDISGSFFREQALALKKQGNTVGVIALHFLYLREWVLQLSNNSPKYFECDNGVKTYRLQSVYWIPKITAAKVFLWKYIGLKVFDQYIKKHGRPNIIHVHSMLYAGLIAKEIQKRYGIPYVITEHSTAFARQIVNPAQILIAQSIALNAFRTFAVSSPFARLLEKSLGCHMGAWEVMPNIVKDSFFLNVLEKKTGQFTFLNISLLTHKKGVDLLLHAFSKAFKRRQSVRLIIVGDGEQRSVLEALAKELEISGQITFLGMLDREYVATQIAASDALVLSSRYETFGVAVIEALASGKPVVATRCGGPEDIVRPEDGLLVPVDDVDQLANAMICLYENFSSYDQQAIRESCRLRYSEQAVAKRLLKVYKKALDGSVTGKALCDLCRD